MSVRKSMTAIAIALAGWTAASVATAQRGFGMAGPLLAPSASSLASLEGQTMRDLSESQARERRQRLVDYEVARTAFEHDDYATARRLFQPMAESGSPLAQFFMGVMMDKALGVARDETVAMKWFRQSAESGLPQAQYVLGLAYLNGQDTKADPKQAARWLRKAAEQGLPHAELTLATLYDSGRGVPEDPKAAARWRAKAAAKGVY